MSDFAFEIEKIDLPEGAYARTHRRRLFWQGRTLLGFSQGDFRDYIYPLNSPAGYAVTSERPADHPHHASLWVAADHVHAQVSTPAGTEEYTYNFYVDETFQGRAPGRIRETDVSARLLQDGGFEIVQTLEWRGPSEWAAPAGRTILSEQRVTQVRAGNTVHRIDIISRLTAEKTPVSLGPTRHALFNLRVADGLIVANGGRLRDNRGRTAGPAISGSGARWVDFCGPVGGSHVAGVTVIPHHLAGMEPFWFVADWGVVTVGPFRFEPIGLGVGEAFSTSCTFLVHDGEINMDDIEAGQSGVTG